MSRAIKYYVEAINPVQPTLLEIIFGFFKSF
jgi:hypothetical protein